MAKSSSKTKGFRQYKQKKPFLTKKEWIILIVAAVVIVGGFIVLVTSNFDGALTVRDGKVDTGGADWIIVNGNTSANPRYFKVGEMTGGLEGWTRQSGVSTVDAIAVDYVFTPEDASLGIKDVTIAASKVGAGVLAENMRSYFTQTGQANEYSAVGDLRTETIGGKEVTWFAFSYDTQDEVAEGGEAAATYTRRLDAFVKATDAYSVAVYVSSEADAFENLASEETLKACLEDALATFTIGK